MHLRTIAALLILGGCLAGCGDEPAPPPLVGVVLRTTEGHYFEQLAEGLRQGAKDQGLRVDVRSADRDPTREAQHLNAFVSMGIAALVICPCDGASVAPSLAPLAAAGIPVFSVEIDAKGAAVVAHIARDHRLAGRLAGEALAKHLHGKGQILVLGHPEGSPVGGRLGGFEDALALHAGMSIVARQVGDGTAERARAQVDEVLRSYPYLSGVFAMDGQAGLGALQAARAAAPEGLIVVGCDATPETEAAVASGSAFKALVVHRPGRMGAAIMHTIAAHLGGTSVAVGVDASADVLERVPQEQR